MTEDLRHSFKVSESRVSMHSELGVSVPNGKVEQKIQNVLVLVVWKQTLKYGQRTLLLVSLKPLTTMNNK